MSTDTKPSQVLIIRHGEKVGDPNKDNDGGRHLSVRGSARAAALPSLFSHAMPQLSCKFHAHEGSFVGEYRQIPLKGAAPRFSTPNYIFATEPSKNSKRPLETVLPLATALNLPVYDSIKDDEPGIKKMVNAILQHDDCDVRGSPDRAPLGYCRHWTCRHSRWRPSHLGSLNDREPMGRNTGTACRGRGRCTR